MRANFRSVLHLSLFCCNTLLVSGHPVSPVGPSTASPGNSVPNLSSSLRRSILPRNNNSTNPSSSGENDGSGGRTHLLEANLTAAIAVAVGLGVLLVLVGLMSAFRMGWSRGLEYQAKRQKFTSEGSSDVSTDPTFVPWQGEPPIIRGMSERDINSPYTVAVGGLGRHSFRPGKGVYKIHDGPEPGAIRNMVAADKGKARGIGNW
ncbi:hypothetical protein C7212DRAFT_340723 [Tuber magnatum]|uniref:Mid2 domain-containing protein n=1 Tax=Tuber magnatum TaxID=42249 RepID=A0A317T204_9PEZI|nr:hypothetical protein C7212DRAFT_340723 [Tuber magnatum]